MKNITIRFVITLAAIAIGFTVASAQVDNVKIKFDSAASEGLDLYAVAELFKDSENLEKFEQSLNNPVNGINNLDLNNDNEVDFINVTEQVKDDTHLIVLQSVLGENEYQDVATIAVERESGEKYNLQIQGDTVIYGENYYVVPANNNFSLWNVVRWIFSPNYRAYVSPFGYRVLPNWWAVRRPVTVNIYRTRAGLLTDRRNFTATKTVTVRTINKISYHRRTSTIVTRRNNITRIPAPRPDVQNRTVTLINQKKTVQTNTKTISRSKRVKN